MDGQRGPLPLPLIDAEKVKAAYSLLYRDEYKDALLGEPDGVDRIAGGLATKANFFAGDKTVTGDRSSDESGRRAVFFAQFIAIRYGPALTAGQITLLAETINAAIRDAKTPATRPRNMEDFVYALRETGFKTSSWPWSPKGHADLNFAESSERYYRGCYTWHKGAHQPFAAWLLDLQAKKYVAGAGVACPALKKDSTLSCWEFVIGVLVAVGKLPVTEVADVYKILVDELAGDDDKASLRSGAVILELFHRRIQTLQAKGRKEVGYTSLTIGDDNELNQELSFKGCDVLILPDPNNPNTKLYHVLIVVSDQKASQRWESVKVMQLWTVSGYFADFTTLGKVLNCSKDFIVVRL